MIETPSTDEVTARRVRGFVDVTGLPLADLRELVGSVEARPESTIGIKRTSRRTYLVVTHDATDDAAATDLGIDRIPASP